MRLVCRMLFVIAPPDLPTRRRVLIQQTHATPVLRGSRRSCHPSRSRTHYEDIARNHPVTISIPSRASIWQVRACSMPSTVARHSMQMPIPQRAALGSPPMDVRHGAPLESIAAATLVPGRTRTRSPLTVRSIVAVASLSVETCMARHPSRPALFDPRWTPTILSNSVYFARIDPNFGRESRPP